MTDRAIAGMDRDPLLPSADGVRIPGVSFRRLRDEADYEAIAVVTREANVTDGIPYVPTAASLRNDFEHIEGFDPRRHVVLAEADGRVVAFGHARRDVREGLAYYWTWGSVLPAYRRRGLGRVILRSNERLLRSIAEGQKDEGGRTFATWVDEKEGGAHELLTAEGYAPARYGFLMRRASLTELPDAPLPAGLELRPVSPDHHRAIFDADEEAFQDHWAHRNSTEEDFVALYAEPELDTTLWQVAWDGDEVAGSVMPYIWKTENEALGVKRGWLERVSVRRPWRRRGLAKALIVSALRALREAGMEEAQLGVDAENPTGALSLYESLGFAVADRSTHFRKAWS